MTYLAPWTTFNMNVWPANQSTAAAQGQSILYFLKTSLVSVGWTVVSSSNSSSFASGGTSTANDLWTSYSTLIWGASQSSSRSWILLASPVGFVAGPNGSYLGAQSQMYFCIDCVSSGGNDGYYNYQFNLNYYSTLPTGGSVSQTPTGGNRQQMSTSYVNYTYPQAQLGIVYTVILSFAAMSNGGFYMTIAEPGTGVLSTVIHFLPLVNVYNYGSLPYPYAAIGGFYYAWGQGNLIFSYMFDSGYNGYITGWNYDGTPGAPRCMYLNSYNGIMPGSGTTVQGDINGNVFLLPGYIYNNVSGGYGGMIGQLPDFYQWVRSQLQMVASTHY